jgi:hypothetical protein
MDKKENYKRIIDKALDNWGDLETGEHESLEMYFKERFGYEGEQLPEILQIAVDEIWSL